MPGPAARLERLYVGRKDPIRRERPGEACQRLVGGDAAGAEAAAHEERRHLRAQSDGQSRESEALGSPAIGEADDEQAGVAGRFEDTYFTRTYENGLGGDSDDLLHQKRSAAKKPAGVAAPESGIGLDSEEP